MPVENLHSECCELLWLRILLKEIRFKQGGPMVLHSDNTSVIKLAKIQYIVRERSIWKLICPFVKEQSQ